MVHSAFAEVRHRVVDVVGQIALGAAEILDLRGLAFETGLEHREHHHVRIGVRAHRANLDAHAALVADRDTNHRAAIDGRRNDLVRRLEVRVEPAIGVDAGIQHQADVVAVGQDAVHEVPGELAELLLALADPRRGSCLPG